MKFEVIDTVSVLFDHIQYTEIIIQLHYYYYM